MKVRHGPAKQQRHHDRSGCHGGGVQLHGNDAGDDRRADGDDQQGAPYGEHLGIVLQEFFGSDDAHQAPVDTGDQRQGQQPGQP